MADSSSSTSGKVPAEDTKGHVEEPKNFAPKAPVQLDPPKDDPITVEELAKCNGELIFRLIKYPTPSI